MITGSGYFFFIKMIVLSLFFLLLWDLITRVICLKFCRFFSFIMKIFRRCCFSIVKKRLFYQHHVQKKQKELRGFEYLKKLLIWTHFELIEMKFNSTFEESDFFCIFLWKNFCICDDWSVIFYAIVVLLLKNWIFDIELFFRNNIYSINSLHHVIMIRGFFFRHFFPFTNLFFVAHCWWEFYFSFFCHPKMLFKKSRHSSSFFSDRYKSVVL